MISKMKGARGLSLMEVMLVTALIALGLILGIAQYQKTIFQRKVAQIQHSVTVLEGALQQYYNVNCYWFLSPAASYTTVYAVPLTTNPTVVPAPSDTSPNPTLSDYIANAGLINNPYAPNASGPAAYTYQIDTRADFPVLSVSTQFPTTLSASQLATLQGLLKPNSVSKGQFSWSIILNQPVKDQFTGIDTNLSYVRAMAGELFMDTSIRQYGMQYMVPRPDMAAGVGSQFGNVCAYWQNPTNRCIITRNSTRCTYQ